MRRIICETKQQLARRAASRGADAIRAALARQGGANIILATGASQFEMLAALVQAEAVAWENVTVFHLDEYVGLPASHAASFRRYLRERFVERLAAGPAAFHAIRGDAPDPHQHCRRLAQLIRRHPIDVAFVGIGENGHLAFNDPPADFETDQPYLVVDLDEACRRQQVGEGWFASLDDVPTEAISMSIRQIMKSKTIVCTVPDGRKARAVRATLEGEITPQVPASILRNHGDCDLFLDRDSASGLSAGP